MSRKALVNIPPPRPTREQLGNVIGVILGTQPDGGPRPISTYEPLGWLLREDVGNAASRRTRRLLYRKLVAELNREFGRIYGERLDASGGPWEFADVYVASGEARKCIRRMRWYAFQHMLRLPGASAGSMKAYDAMMKLFEGREIFNPAAGRSIS